MRLLIVLALAMLAVAVWDCAIVIRPCTSDRTVERSSTGTIIKTHRTCRPESESRIHTVASGGRS
jgi:hypothetical protein